MRIYNDTTCNLEVEAKADDTPLTSADKAAHAVIAEALGQTGIPVLSEEGKHLPFEERRRWNRLWLADPLDGTKEFINRNGDFTVNIALIVAKRPVLGVIYAPVQETLYLGFVNQSKENTDTGKQEPGHQTIGHHSTRSQEPTNKDIVCQGAWRLDIPAAGATFETILQKGARLPLSDGPRQYTVLSSRSHMNDATREYMAGLRKSHEDIRMVAVGSSLKFCMMAEGNAHIYPRLGRTMEWDTAAGQAIAEAAGKTVLRTDNSTPLEYNKESLENPFFVCQ